MTPVEDWKTVLWRSWTVRLSALSGAVQALYVAWPTLMLDIWNALPDPLKAVLPYRVAMFIPLVLTLAAIAARPIVQRKISGSK